MSDSDDIDYDLSPTPRVDTSYLSASATDQTTPSTLSKEEQLDILRERSQSKGMIFKQLGVSMQLNDFGLPDYVYRADMIPDDIFYRPNYERHSILEAATITINWDHGYPATLDATPLWEQLPGETRAAYNAFIHYLELPQTSSSDKPVRMLPLLSQALEIPLHELSDYSNMYYWSIRFKAYDLFLLACHQKQKEQRIMTIEGKHFRTADNYLNKLDIIIGKRLDKTIQELQDEDSAVHDDLKLKDLVDMVQKLTTIQRVAVGLPANGNDTSETAHIGRRHQQVTDAFREIVTHSTPGRKQDNRSAQMDEILSNPEDLAAAQELIIKASRGS